MTGMYLCGHYLPGIGWCPNDAAKGRLMCPDHARITYLTEDDGPDEDRHEYDDRSHYYQH